MEVLVQKTIEFLIVDISDFLHTLSDLTGTNPVYDVINSSNVYKYTQEPAVQDGTNKMRIYCLINTNLGGIWTPGDYRLYTSFTTSPEVPRVGPFLFKVDPE